MIRFVVRGHTMVLMLAVLGWISSDNDSSSLVVAFADDTPAETTTMIPNDEPETTTTTSRSLCQASPLMIPKTVTSRSSNSKLIIAHRGASAHLPEHSLAAYRLAYELGADYAEPDLVATKDGHLVAVHSMDLNITTNVQQVFPNRTKFSKFLDKSGYWTYMFTLDELQQLNIHQRLPQARSTIYDGMFTIPTLTELLQLLLEWNMNIGPQLGLHAFPEKNNNQTTTKTSSSTTTLSRVGIYAELKDTEWLLEDTGVDLVELLFQHINDNGDLWQQAIGEYSCKAKRVTDYLPPPLVIQSFDGKALESVHKQWPTKIPNNVAPPPLVLLVDYEHCTTDQFWYKVDESWRELLQGIGPDKRCCQELDFMEHAEMLGLAVHPWTIRPEAEYHPKFATSQDELLHLFCHETTGHNSYVHGVFTEAVSDAVAVASHLDCSTIMDLKNGSKNKNSKHNQSQQQQQGDGSIVLLLEILGVILLLMVVVCVAKAIYRRSGTFANKQRRPRHDDSAPVPTADELQLDEDDDDDDHEML